MTIRLSIKTMLITNLLILLLIFVYICTITYTIISDRNQYNQFLEETDLEKNNEDSYFKYYNLTDLDRLLLLEIPNVKDEYQIIIPSPDGTMAVNIFLNKEDLRKFNERVVLLINEN